MRPLLLNADPSPGGPPNQPEQPSQAPVAPPVVQASPAPPPAAKIVLEGTKTEKEIVLEKTLKERETRISELEDENHRLKSPLKPTTEPRKPAPSKKSWHDGAFFLDDD